LYSQESSGICFIYSSKTDKIEIDLGLAPNGLTFTGGNNSLISLFNNQGNILSLKNITASYTSNESDSFYILTLTDSTFMTNQSLFIEASLIISGNSNFVIDNSSDASLTADNINVFSLHDQNTFMKFKTITVRSIDITTCAVNFPETIISTTYFTIVSHFDFENDFPCPIPTTVFSKIDCSPGSEIKIFMTYESPDIPSDESVMDYVNTPYMVFQDLDSSDRFDLAISTLDGKCPEFGPGSPILSYTLENQEALLTITNFPSYFHLNICLYQDDSSKCPEIYSHTSNISSLSTFELLDLTEDINYVIADSFNDDQFIDFSISSFQNHKRIPVSITTLENVNPNVNLKFLSDASKNSVNDLTINSSINLLIQTTNNEPCPLTSITLNSIITISPSSSSLKNVYVFVSEELYSQSQWIPDLDAQLGILYESFPPIKYNKEDVQIGNSSFSYDNASKIIMTTKNELEFHISAYSEQESGFESDLPLIHYTSWDFIHSNDYLQVYNLFLYFESQFQNISKGKAVFSFVPCESTKEIRMKYNISLEDQFIPIIMSSSFKNYIFINQHSSNATELLLPDSTVTFLNLTSELPFKINSLTLDQKADRISAANKLYVDSLQQTDTLAYPVTLNNISVQKSSSISTENLVIVNGGDFSKITFYLHQKFEKTSLTSHVTSDLDHPFSTLYVLLNNTGDDTNIYKEANYSFLHGNWNYNISESISIFDDINSLTIKNVKYTVSIQSNQTAAWINLKKYSKSFVHSTGFIILMVSISLVLVGVIIITVLIIRKKKISKMDSTVERLI